MMDRLLENDTVLKILSVLVAIFLWLQVDGVTSHPVQKREFLDTLSVQWSLSKATGLSVVALRPATVDVQLQGTSKSLGGVNKDNVTPYVNLSGITRAGVYTLRLSAAVPSGTRTVSISPPQVTVSLDTIGSRRVQVSVAPQGNVPPKYEVISMVPSVGEATLSGPTQDLNQVKRVVAVVPLSGHTQGFEDQSLLLPESASGAQVPHVEVNPPMVSVSSVIRQKPPQVTVGVVVRVSGHPAVGYKISSIVVNPNQISITGPSSLLRKITTVYTSAIDVSGVTGPVTGALPVSLPSGVSPVSGHNLVQVTVNVEPKSP